MTFQPVSTSGSNNRTKSQKRRMTSPSSRHGVQSAGEVKPAGSNTSTSSPPQPCREIANSRSALGSVSMSNESTRSVGTNSPGVTRALSKVHCPLVPRAAAPDMRQAPLTLRSIRNCWARRTSASKVPTPTACRRSRAVVASVGASTSTRTRTSPRKPHIGVGAQRNCVCRIATGRSRLAIKKCGCTRVSRNRNVAPVLSTPWQYTTARPASIR